MYFELKQISFSRDIPRGFSTILVLSLSAFVAYRKRYSLYEWCIFILIFFIMKYYWDKRWLYYYASRFDGPFAFPLIGNAHLLIGSIEDSAKKILKITSDFPEIFRVWIGWDLYIFNSRPEHVEVILNKCLEKPPDYKILTGDQINNSTFVSPVNRWRKNRKLINPTYNPTIIKSFQDNFARSSRRFVERFKDKCQKELYIYPHIWRATLESTFENLLGVDHSVIDNPDQLLKQMLRWEEINILRLRKPWLHPTIFWKLSSLYKDSISIISVLHNFINKWIQMKRSQHNINNLGDEDIKKFQLVNHLINNESKLTEKELIEEIHLMTLASSETNASVQNHVLLILGISPEIQQKIYEELYTIFGDSDRDATLEDLNRMDYLERVIKETLRLFPTAYMISRFVDSDLKIDDYVYPKGSNIIIPIAHIHRTPKLWRDPLKFDPDRFLPEEVKKRHRCAYIPFSVGPRNCPGYLYGMMSMKNLLSAILRHYKVVSCNFQSVEDITVIFNLVTKASKDFKVVLEERTP